MQAVQRAEDPAQQPDPAGGGHAVPVRRQAAGRARARGAGPRALPPPRRAPPPPPRALRLLPSRGKLIGSSSTLATSNPRIVNIKHIMKLVNVQEIEIQSCGRGGRLIPAVWAVLSPLLLRQVLST